MQYQIKNINWLNTIFANMNDANSITIEILVKAWSIYENLDTNWISHFLEHMFFKWWIKYSTPEIVAQAVDEIWWESNAFTSEEYAGYYIKCAPEYTTKAIDILADMLVWAQFPKEELEREKEVVIQEIMMYEDMPHRLVIDKWKEFFYGNNSYGWNITGTVDNVKKFDQDYLINHKESLYTRDNLIITVAWKIENQNEIEDLINKLFSKLPEKTTIQKPIIPNFKPASNKDFYNKWTEQSHIVIWAKWFNISENEKYAANLLWILLGWNMSSRLFQEIREKLWLCYYISASHYTNELDWIFMIRAGVDKKRLEKWVEAIHSEISKIANWEISLPEFEKSLGYIKWKTKMWIETSDQMADFLWEQFIMKWNIKSLDEILREYEKLQIEQIREVAKKLHQDNLYMYYIK